jgi:hypothetical protein
LRELFYRHFSLAFRLTRLVTPIPDLSSSKSGIYKKMSVAIAVFRIIASCILFATLLARTDPDLPCTVVLNKAEWQALYCNIQRVPEPAPTPPTLAQAVSWIARLGGFLARKGDGPPGPHVLWRGFEHLPYITDMFLIMRRNE